MISWAINIDRYSIHLIAMQMRPSCQSELYSLYKRQISLHCLRRCCQTSHDERRQSWVSNVSCYHTVDTICQMSSWWTKNSLHSINTRDTVTNLVPSCSVHQAPVYESNLTLLAPVPTKFAYLSIVFILEMICTACIADHLKDK